MSSQNNKTSVDDYLFSLFENNWGEFMYLCLILVFSCAPLVMLCIYVIRSCLWERDWELEEARQEHRENVRRLVAATTKILGNQAASQEGDSLD